MNEHQGTVLLVSALPFRPRMENLWRETPPERQRGIERERQGTYGMSDASSGHGCGDGLMTADGGAGSAWECGRAAGPVRFSLHALRRAARRNVVHDAVEYVLAYGRVLHRTGITFYFLAARDIPAEDRRAAWAVRLIGTVVLMGPDGEIITVYRNRRALPSIRRKLKYRLAPRVAPSSAGVEGAEEDGQPLTA